MTAAAESRDAVDRLPPSTGTLALSVHGAAGVLDLLVPDGATAVDVLREYARQTGGRLALRLFDGRGREVPLGRALGDLGIRSGGVLVAADTVPASRPRAQMARPETRSGVGPVFFVGIGVAGILATLGAIAGVLSGEVDRDLVVGVLLGGAVLGALPFGRGAELRARVAPAFGAAGGLLAAWDPTPERLPMVFGIVGISAAVTAAVAAALGEGRRDVLRVWMWAGASVFVVTGAGAVFGLDDRVVWSALLLLAMLAGRVVPSIAVDVPDQALVDIDRLAVSAWSARERPRRSRSRTMVSREFVEEVVDRGSRLVSTAAAAVLVVTLVAAPLVVTTSDLPIDRFGAPVLVTLVGCTQLLVARSYRHTYARWFLRFAGLWCLGVVLVLVVSGQEWRSEVGVVAFVVGGVLVPVGVAVGRGWRSVWWSRRAEIAEGLAVAFSIPAFVVTVGVFRRIWEMVG